MFFVYVLGVSPLKGGGGGGGVDFTWYYPDAVFAVVVGELAVTDSLGPFRGRGVETQSRDVKARKLLVCNPEGRSANLKPLDWATRLQTWNG